MLGLLVAVVAFVAALFTALVTAWTAGHWTGYAKGERDRAEFERARREERP